MAQQYRQSITEECHKKYLRALQLRGEPPRGSTLTAFDSAACELFRPPRKEALKAIHHYTFHLLRGILAFYAREDVRIVYL